MQGTKDDSMSLSACYPVCEEFGDSLCRAVPHGTRLYCIVLSVT